MLYKLIKINSKLKLHKYQRHASMNCKKKFKLNKCSRNLANIREKFNKLNKN